MKKFLSVLVITLSFITIGCNENSLQTLDTSVFEKRTPVKKDTVIRRVPIEQILPCLGLTREQHIIISGILKEGKKCEIECKTEFNDSVKILRQEYNVKMEQYHRVDKTEEIKKEIQIITFEYRQTLRDLQKEHREKIALCVKNIHTDIEKVLTENQLKLWNIWLATGKIPCDKARP
jgi:hypothetical protein